MYLSPAKYVIHVFGGVRPTARAIGRDPSTVCKWPLPRAQKGCDGKIPGGVFRTILKEAKKRKLDITANDLIFGRNIKRK
jgi:hypothetical protein